jgi:aromatic ring-cleaving dioxygenase
MKTFAQFISEGWDNRYRKSEPWAAKDLRHTKKIGPHHVTTIFNHHEGDHFGVHFAINNMTRSKDLQRKPLSPAHKHAVLHHVHKTIDRFIRHRKPTSVQFYSNENGAKDKLYGQFAKRIAKTHGGKVKRHTEGVYSVSFKRKWHGLGWKFAE